MKYQRDLGKGHQEQNLHRSHLCSTAGRGGGEADTLLSTAACARMAPGEFGWDTAAAPTALAHPGTIPWEHSPGEESHTARHCSTQEKQLLHSLSQAASQGTQAQHGTVLPKEGQRGPCPCCPGSTQREGCTGVLGDPSLVPWLRGSSARQQQP